MRYEKTIQRFVRVMLAFTFLLLFQTWHLNTLANNILVQNSKLVPHSNSSSLVEFDLSWENSWRVSDLGDGVGNWDAAWVFVKYRVPLSEGGDGLWNHAWLSTDNNHHSVKNENGVAATITIGTTDIEFNGSTAPRGMGAFVHRSEYGHGNINWQGVSLQWNFAEQGHNIADLVDIKIFAIEMVYVAEGAFYVGSGVLTSGNFKDGTTNNPFLISSEDPLEIGNEVGKLWGSSTSGNNTIGSEGTLAAAYPKGFTAFYMMKYSISQQQYVDFLNTLTRAQQDSRTGTNLAAGVTSVTNRYVMSNSSTMEWRNGIRCDATIPANSPITFYCDLNNNDTPSEADDGQWIACNWLSWPDGAAYTDWAGLRPMTELEYEKAARGLATPVANEYAWGTATVASSDYTLGNAGTASEGINANYSTTAGNAIYNLTRGSIGGPLRVGIFAAHGSNSGRITAGASYWGIMELSGNVGEFAVSVGHNTGRNFTGLHGDGTLSAAGHANVTAWPGLWVWDGGVTRAWGIGQRGGGFGSADTRIRVSDRFSSQNSIYYLRGGGQGLRAVRSAPFTAGEIQDSGETICAQTAAVQISSIMAANAGDGVIQYRWQSSADEAFSSPTVIEHNQPDFTPPSDLTADIWYRRQAKDDVQDWTTSAGIWKVTVISVPDAPAEGTHDQITKSEIRWQWNSVSGATGYRWHTADDFDAATDVGTDTHHLETGLNPGTSYTRYVWAYNSCYNSAVKSITETTAEPEDGDTFTFTDTRDDQEYLAVYIGDQLWMAENLNYVPTSGSWCYQNDPSNCDLYGRLYNWSTAMDGASSSATNPSGVQGICPPGWHLPSDSEWRQLVSYVGTEPGRKLKSDRTDPDYDHPRWDYHETNFGLDTFGFSGLPGGRRIFGGFSTFGETGYWWTTTEFGSDSATAHVFSYSTNSVSRYHSDKTTGYSVRCVRDE